jgi:hypothetical protein
LHRGLDRLAVVAGNESAERGAPDHEQFDRLEQDAEVPAHEAVATEHGTDHHDVSNQNQHALPLVALRRQTNQTPTSASRTRGTFP